MWHTVKIVVLMVACLVFCGGCGEDKFVFKPHDYKNNEKANMGVKHKNYYIGIYRGRIYVKKKFNEPK